MEQFKELEEYLGWAHMLMDGQMRSSVSEVERDMEEDVSAQILGGKRFRPSLTVLVCQALGGDPVDAVPYTSPVEFIHEGSLAADDVLDLTGVRRGIKSIPQALGVAESFQVGLAVITKAVKDLRHVNGQMALSAIDTIHDMCCGALKEMHQSPSFVEDKVLEIIALKTSALYGFSCECGALAAGAGPEWEQLMRQYGVSLGTAFQMADDLADLYEVLNGGEKGDFSMPRVTYPLYCMWLSGPKLQNAATRWVAGKLDLDELLSLIQTDNSGILRAKRKINSFHNACLAVCERLPESRYRALLELVPKYTELKMLEEVGALQDYIALDEG